MVKVIEFKEKKENDEMIPLEEWDGECWELFFEQFCVPNAKQSGKSPWDIFANFVKVLLSGEGGKNGRS